MKAKWIYPLIAATALVACAKDGGGSSGEASSRPSGEISGTAFDGLIKNGEVTVSALDGQVVGSATTNEKGIYTVSLNAIPSQPLKLEIDSGTYKEEYSGETIVLKDGKKLTALINYDQGETITTSVTYFTTIAAGYAEYKIASGMDAKSAIDESNDAVSQTIGIDILTVRPVDITDELEVTPSLTEGQKYGYFTASVSAFTAWVSTANNFDVHEAYNSIVFAQLAYDDIKFDGKLDGVGSTGATAMGKVQFSPDTYRYELALNMLVMANHENNKLGYVPADLSRYAKVLNESANPIFAGAEIKPINADGAIVTNPSWLPTDAFYGDVTISASAFDIVGITAATLTINGVTFTTDNHEEPTFAFDSTQFQDGTYQAVIAVTNATNVVTEFKQNITFANRATAIVSTNPADGQSVSGEYEFGAVVADPFGIDHVTFVFDDSITMEANDPKTPSVKVDTKNTLGSEGQHKLAVRAVGLSGYEAAQQISFFVDNTAPTATTNLAAGAYVSSAYTLNGDISDNLGVKSASIMIDGKEIQSISAKGAYSISFDPQNYSEGSHTLTIDVFDQANNKGTLTQKFYVDRNPPTVNITTASGSAITKSTAISFEASDTLGFGSQTFVAQIVGYPADIAVINNTDRSFQLDPTKLWMAEGNQTLQLTVTDASGKTATDSILVNFQHIATSLSVTQGSTSFSYAGTCYDENGSYSCTSSDSAYMATFTFGWASGMQTINSLQFSGSEIKGAYFNGLTTKWAAGKSVSNQAGGFVLYARKSLLSCKATKGTLAYTITDEYGVTSSGSIDNFSWCTGDTSIPSDAHF